MLSIGVHYNKGNWKTCLMENGHTLELRLFKDICAALEYVQFHCAIFPEPVIALSINTHLTPKQAYTGGHLPETTLNSDPFQREDEVNVFLIAISSSNHNTYGLPPVNQLPHIPVFRRHHRPDMGGSDMLCATALLLYRMRMREAIWQDVRVLPS